MAADPAAIGAFLDVMMILALFLIMALLLVYMSIGNFIFGISTDVNRGDVDDTFALMYLVMKGFFVNGWLSYARAAARWFIPLVHPYTVRIALETAGDVQLLLKQLSAQMYGRVVRVRGGFLSANYELIEVYQSGYKVVFPQGDQSEYKLLPVRGSLQVHLLIIAGPTSCQFNVTRQLLYVGRLLLQGRKVDRITGANAKELSRGCVENALCNGALVSELPVQFSRSVLCSLSYHSQLLAIAAQLQLNPWAFSFPQHGRETLQFAESNQQIGALLLAKMHLTYNSLWEKLDDRVRAQVTGIVTKLPKSDRDIVRNRILWAVFNFGGQQVPWRSETCTSVKPPFNDLCSILRIDNGLTPLELFEFRVQRVSSFTGLPVNEVANVLSHAVLYDLYAVVLLKYGLSAEKVASDPDLMTWFSNYVQTFVDLSSRLSGH